jgi:hypothetical protein
MRKLILFVLLIASIGATAQNQDVNPYGGIYYNDHSNYRMYGANGLPRTDHANIDTLTNVLKGDLRFDTLNAVVVVYDGTAWVDLAFSYSNSAIVRDASLTIVTADVLHLNTTPIEIVSAPGAGYAIEVISASMKMVYNSATYATNTSLELLTAGATNSQASTVIKNSASTIRRFADATTLASATATQLVDNAALNVTVASGDPTAGDSDITVYVTYRIITL